MQKNAMKPLILALKDMLYGENCPKFAYAKLCTYQIIEVLWVENAVFGYFRLKYSFFGCDNDNEKKKNSDYHSNSWSLVTQ